MRDHVAICLRNLTGAKGKFSPELEAFWTDVERQYKCCNVMMIPQEHIPLWHARAVDKGIPIDAEVPTAKPEAPPRPPDLRTAEGRAWKRQTAGVAT